MRDILTDAEFGAEKTNEAVYSYVREQRYSNAFFGASDAAEDYIMYYSKYNDGTWNDGAYIEFGPDVMIICEWD